MWDTDAAIYIDYVDIPSGILAKVGSKHGLSAEDVHDVCYSVPRARWDHHPVHGLRLIATGRTRTGRTLFVVLQPIDPSDGTWRLRTAIPDD